MSGAVIALYGRLGQAPRPITTASGKAMTVVSVAVDVPMKGEDRHSEWFGLVAFGEVAQRLARHQQSDMVSVSGRLQLNAWTAQDGTARQQWQVVVDTLVSARTVRPGGTRRTAPPGGGAAERQAPQREFDDPIPF